MTHFWRATAVTLALALGGGTPAAAGWAEVREAYLNGDAAALVSALRPLAEGGDAEAQFNFGILHDTGQGVHQDYALAALWYGRAGDQDHPTALYNLGLLYYEGKGVERDPARSLELYRRAARHGEADALSSIGYMFLHGDGVEKDRLEGLAYFLLAAERGSADGARNRDVVMGSFDSNDFAFARMRSRDLASEFPAPSTSPDVNGAVEVPPPASSTAAVPPPAPSAARSDSPLTQAAWEAGVPEGHYERLHGKISKAAARSYPRRSLEFGEEGTVVMLIRLRENGTLVDIKILEERTHAPARLRRAAQRAVARAAPFDPLPQGAGVRSIVLPVVYRITARVPEEYYESLYGKISEIAARSYPRRSLEFGEEGTVVMLVRVRENGTLMDITILEERTHAPARLRRAAQRAVARAAPFDPLPQGAGVRSIVLPVVYRYRWTDQAMEPAE